MAHPNEDLVLEAFAAFGRGDIGALRNQYFADGTRMKLDATNVHKLATKDRYPERGIAPSAVLEEHPSRVGDRGCDEEPVQPQRITPPG